jgi:hypothetical protein
MGLLDLGVTARTLSFVAELPPSRGKEVSVFRESTFSRETLHDRQGRASIPPIVWWDEAPYARPPRTLRPLWLAAGAATIFGGLLFAADTRENSVAHFASSSSNGEARFDDATAAFAVVRTAVDAPVALVVPQASVSLVDGKPTVYVAEPALHLFVATPVGLGECIRGEQRITSGLVAGQRVVTGDLSALERQLQ